MCGINAVINGTIEQLHKMIDVASPRGIQTSIVEHENAFVHFSWLPTTDPSIEIQPLTHGRTTMWFNGFISNWKELSEKYNIQMESNCDSELLVKFLDKFQFTKIHELNGFYAILVHLHSLDLPRITDGWAGITDRYGIKQLYEYHDGKTTFISSEVKTILNANTQIKIDNELLNDFSHDLGVMNLNTLYDGIFRVKQLGFPRITPFKGTYMQAVEQLKILWNKSVERNKTSNDCVFLSGGVDSGIIAESFKPEYSFSMDYCDPNFSETENIKLNSTGKHISLICNKQLFDEYIQKTVKMLDDPRAGSSYTNVALTELASKFSKTIYSGAGGDEFFGGYPHRTNKPINEVIKRTNLNSDPKIWSISHHDYDLLFLASILVIEDCIGGNYTMETRFPLLDNDIVDFARSLPDAWKENKLILKEISNLHPNVLNSPKKGFSNPFITNDQWAKLIINNIKS
jgi:asparagine synthase (glutamine-hydrolysing)